MAKASRGASKSLFEMVRAHVSSLDEARFADAVSTNLKHGRLLLVIAGDGIREGVENLTGFLDRLGRLEFTFGLVELGIYRLPDGQLLLQPRVLAKTMIVRRSLVRIESEMPPRLEEEGEEQESSEDVCPQTQFYTGARTITSFHVIALAFRATRHRSSSSMAR